MLLEERWIFVRGDLWINDKMNLVDKRDGTCALLKINDSQDWFGTLDKARCSVNNNLSI